jgi:hypothetical protein
LFRVLFFLSHFLALSLLVLLYFCQFSFYICCFHVSVALSILYLLTKIWARDVSQATQDANFLSLLSDFIRVSCLKKSQWRRFLLQCLRCYSAVHRTVVASYLYITALGRM